MIKNHDTNVDKKMSDNQSVVQLIVFLAGNEEFGVPIDVVREIIKMIPITPIPDTADFIKGIINVRGEIVTAIDIKARFSLPEKKFTEPKHIVVTKQAENLYGLIVDEVIEVLRIQKLDIKPPPSLISQIHRKYVTGVVSNGDRLIIVLDLNNVLSEKELIKTSNAMKNKKNKDKDKNKKIILPMTDVEEVKLDSSTKNED